MVIEIFSYCSRKKVENFQNYFYSVEKVWLGSETFSQEHKEVSEIVGERQQITVTSIHWLTCEITETERIVDQFSEIPELEFFFPTSIYWYHST